MRFNFFTILIIFSVLRLIFGNKNRYNQQKTKSGNKSQSDSIEKAKRIASNMGDQYEEIFGSIFVQSKKSDNQKSAKKKGYWEDIFNPTTATKPKNKKAEKKETHKHSAEGQSLEGYSMHMRGYDEDDMDHKRKAAKAYHSEKVEIGDELLVQNIQETSEPAVGLNLFGFAGGGTGKSEIRRAIVYSEIFGKPKSMRRH